MFCCNLLCFHVLENNQLDVEHLHGKIIYGFTSMGTEQFKVYPHHNLRTKHRNDRRTRPKAHGHSTDNNKKRNKNTPRVSTNGNPICTNLRIGDGGGDDAANRALALITAAKAVSVLVSYAYHAHQFLLVSTMVNPHDSAMDPNEQQSDWGA